VRFSAEAAKNPPVRRERTLKGKYADFHLEASRASGGECRADVA
jgi:hypothetical protein